MTTPVSRVELLAERLAASVENGLRLTRLRIVNQGDLGHRAKVDIMPDSAGIVFIIDDLQIPKTGPDSGFEMNGLSFIIAEIIILISKQVVLP